MTRVIVVMRHLRGREAHIGLDIHACPDIQRDAVTADAEDTRDCDDKAFGRA